MSYIEKDAYAKSLSIKLNQVGEEFTLAEMTINESHMNGVGSVHGAVIFALADIAFAAACNQEQSAVGIQADIRYLAKPTGNKLLAEAKLISSSRKFANYQIAIKDEMNTLIAQFSGMGYIISK